MRLRSVLLAALLLAPTAALAAPGIVTVSTGLRAGPGSGFPLVDRIPEGARVNIHGCLRGNAWCDVSFSDDRGWVSSQYLEYLYRNHYVYLPDYVDEIDVPVAPFVLSSYWSSYYTGRPWYRRHAYWNNYWGSHERVATRMTLDPRAARIGRTATREATVALGREGVHGKAGAAVAGRDAATTRRDAAIAKRDAAAATDRTRVGRTDRALNERANLKSRNARDAQARMMHEPAASRAASRAQAMTRAQQPIARPHEAPRMSAAPAARPAMPRVAQPNVSHGSPMNARAQMPAPAPRAAAPAMPHPGGGAPQINAAPRGGGAPAGGIGAAHQRH
ncbi:SH3 domain-containing protein [Bradyrhizobium diazoefficiens]|nr:SH3 domain-containing protein [Bradyrhizobium diazoefficiens]MBR0776003.1 SH3 domain-containing protein [Bradyrhizobium diazoefficiens]